MRLIVTQDASMIADVTCEREDVYVGAREDCRVHLADARIPDQLAVISPSGAGHWTIRILENEPVTHLNGARIEDEHPLSTGDEIKIREFVVRVFPEQHGRSRRATAVSRLNQFVQTHLPGGSMTKRVEDAVALEPGRFREVAGCIVRLGNSDSVEGVMDIALKLLLEQFGAAQAWIGVRRVNYGPMDRVEGRRVTGQTIELPELGENLKPRVLDRGQFIFVPQVSAEQRMSLLLGPVVGSEGNLGMIYLETAPGSKQFLPEQLEYFMIIAGLVGAQVDAILKQLARNRAATIAGEISVAHAIQSRLTPRKLPQWDDRLGFGAFREPGTEHTGDFYDIVKLGNGTAMFLVAHTPASGAIPSLLMAQVHAGFRLGAMHLDAPHVLLKSLNWIMYDGQTDHPLHCCVGVIQPDTGAVQYSVAGQLGAFVIGQRGDERPLLPEEALPPLSSARGTDYPDLSETLEPGETLALFTPGVTTARNRGGEIFGEDRFMDILCDGFGQLAGTILKEMMNDLRGFTEGGMQPQDITVVLAHRS